MLTPTTSACEYNKKSPREPCAHSVPTYVASSSLSNTFRTQLPRRAQNYISATTIRDIKALRNDLLSALQSAGLVPSTPEAHAREPEPELLKALLLAALYPRVARIALKAVKYTPGASGAVKRDAHAREWRAKDMRGERVWVHPASVQFAETRWRSGVVVSFRRVETAKVFLRDVTEVSHTHTRCRRLFVDARRKVPLYALLMFGGHIDVDHVRGGLTIGRRAGEGAMRMRAWPRIAILVQQLRCVYCPLSPPFNASK
jgi:ATP-dependent RNA helicase DHX57